MNYILFDDVNSNNLLPLTFTRPVADLRIGILTIREKWEKMLGVKTSSRTKEYLSKKFPLEFAIDTDNVWINGGVCPNEKLIEELKTLEPYQALMSMGHVLAVNTGDQRFFTEELNEDFIRFESHAQALRVEHPWDLFAKNGEAIKADFDLITAGRKSLALSATNQVMGVENIFVE